jgi:NADH-quinone oxidoreductase subunit M
MAMGPITWIVLSPFIGVLLILAIPKNREDWIRRISVLASGIPLSIVLVLMVQYDRLHGGYQWVERVAWIPSLGIQYQVGADGISLTLLALHALASFTGVLISYRILNRVKEYFIFYLILIGGVYGVFSSLDLFFFYLFYEMAVIPMFPLIGIWGSGDKDYATMKLTLYLTAGAVLALFGLLGLYWMSGAHSFDLIFLERYLRQNPLPGAIQRWLFPFLLIGFGVIAPMWPLHSWSPVGHAAAPSAVSMLHAGVLMKLGSYAILRIGIQTLPEGAFVWLPWVAGIACMNILYGGWVAMAQKDIKFLIGYSSSSHMGYVLLGLACLNPVGLNGAVLLMFAHGLMTALAFAAVGHIYDQTHTRIFADWGGLARQTPFIATAFTMAALASSGLPGFANFVSELLVFFGAWNTYRLPAIVAVLGIVITAFYMLRGVRTAFFGPLNPKWIGVVQDATPFERIPYLVLLGSLIVVGCWPRMLTDLIASSSGHILEHLYPMMVMAQR